MIQNLGHHMMVTQPRRDGWIWSLDDEGVPILADALARNNTIRKLHLGGNGSITTTGWRALFTQLQSPQSSLEELFLWENSIADAAAIWLANALANGTHLKALNLERIDSITSDGWQSIFNALSSPHCMLLKLNLSCNGFSNEDVTHLANSLTNNCRLIELDISINSEVTSSGWRAFAAVLQNPNSALEKVDLTGNQINNDILVSFANSLAGNKKLKELILDDEEDTIITNWDVLSDMLCKKSSIMDTFNSNHTLHTIFSYNEDSHLPSDFLALLLLNSEHTKFEAARRKILSVHFSGDFNMQPFIDMNAKVVPHAIAWVARDEHGSSFLYQFVRYTSFFLGVDGGVGTESANEPESKRQKMSTG